MQSKVGSVVIGSCKSAISLKQRLLTPRGSCLPVLLGLLTAGAPLALGQGAAAASAPSSATCTAGCSPAAQSAMEFADQPNFTVAGVTDWTAVGGHGSDSTLRTSEDLARETLALKAAGTTPGLSAAPSPAFTAAESKLRTGLAEAPGSFAANRQLGALYFQAGRYPEALPLLRAAHAISTQDDSNSYDLAVTYQQTGDLVSARDLVNQLLQHENTADLHRLLGAIDEQMNDPLTAVRQDEQAARLEPTEQNYFAWGSELLLHRAVWQAVDVFKNGAKAYPDSPRMLTALGTALFAGARYDEAAASVCGASDLKPTDPEPYLFMGRIQMAAPEPLPCIPPRLEKFVQQQPLNGLANYFLAMALLKSPQPDPQTLQHVQTLLSRAVMLDPACADAYLQLGILAGNAHQPEKAIAFYLQAIAANPQLGEAHYRLAVAYDRMGASEKARQEFATHDAIEKLQAAQVERQRREVKQFLVVLQAPQPSK